MNRSEIIGTESFVCYCLLIVKHIFTLLIFLSLISGCGKEPTFPASRMEQPAGSFSMVTPEGWYRKKLAGLEFIIVSATPDYGFRSNIFVDGIQPSIDLDKVANAVIERSQNAYQDYESIKQSDFKTESGMTGLKLESTRKDMNQLPLSTFQYLIKDSERTLIFSCSCAETMKAKYESIFDDAISSIESNIK